MKLAPTNLAHDRHLKSSWDSFRESLGLEFLNPRIDRTRDKSITHITYCSSPLPTTYTLYSHEFYTKQ